MPVKMTRLGGITAFNVCPRQLVGLAGAEWLVDEDPAGFYDGAVVVEGSVPGLLRNDVVPIREIGDVRFYTVYDYKPAPSVSILRRG